MIEHLEARRLLSAVYYDADSHSIKVHGTEGNDTISLIRRGERILVQLNDRRRWFDLTKVQFADIDAFGGDDSVDAQYVPFRVFVFGRAGRDTLIGGWGDDLLDGGDNADRIIGNHGDDNITGGGGRDRLIGNRGRDTLQGDGGDDQISAGSGDDYITGSVGNDLIDGGDGADALYHYPSQGSPRSIEEHLFAPGEIPAVFVSASIDRNGIVSATVWTQFGGGQSVTFGDQIVRDGDTFIATVNGFDPDPGGLHTANLLYSDHTYVLGKLADGFYNVTAKSDSAVRAAATIHVVDGKLLNTPASDGAPWLGRVSVASG